MRILLLCFFLLGCIDEETAIKKAKARIEIEDKVTNKCKKVFSKLNLKFSHIFYENMKEYRPITKDWANAWGRKRGYYCVHKYDDPDVHDLEVFVAFHEDFVSGMEYAINRISHEEKN